MNRTLVILCGGDSSRMGTKKALLPFEDKTMVEYIYDKFSPFFDKVYLSVNERGDLAHLGLDAQEIPDISRNAGPYGAILSCLTMITGDRAFFMSVDTPFLDPRTAVYLYDQSYNYDITTFRFPDNLLDTICDVYNKRCIGAFFKSLVKGLYYLALAEIDKGGVFLLGAFKTQENVFYACGLHILFPRAA